MRTLAQFLSWLALVTTLVPALLYLTGTVDLALVKAWMLGTTIVWFLTVPWWMDRKAE